MGGSVVTKSCPILLQNKYKIAGVAVLDVVEGSAVDALPHMNSILNARPDGFDSVEEAVEWQYVLFDFSRVLSISKFLPVVSRRTQFKMSNLRGYRYQG